MSIVTTWKRGVYHVPCILRSQNKILASGCYLVFAKCHPSFKYLFQLSC